jgi:hypothetical protein
LLLPATAIAVLVLAGCAASPASTPSATENDAGPTAEAGTPAAVGDGQLFGCTDAMISFMDANGYLNPTPADPTRFVFPEAGKPRLAACYVEDDTAERSARERSSSATRTPPSRRSAPR